ncbi:Peptidase C39 family protein [Roseateles sp. YR242]|uniref:cysteine peptidase family C39 domain-containing protein n=1 Tax=Roseateles sp. YR242 TaxID=1855305 RepID=UPI0008C1E582|nr:cysteine peptidase family C39 domain-containing protein [Roseateles sp. YR242]SEL92840.1 Peptidase C39 family protein [Roseateles sp. YR242]
MKEIIQSEAAECGLACLAMVASHFGHSVGLRELRRDFPVSSKGSTLVQLISIARHLDITCRPLRCEIDGLPEVKLLAILHWGMSHYVVLAAWGRSGRHLRPV